jgi:hypothetical protein
MEVLFTHMEHEAVGRMPRTLCNNCTRACSQTCMAHKGLLIAVPMRGARLKICIYSAARVIVIGRQCSATLLATRVEQPCEDLKFVQACGQSCAYTRLDDSRHASSTALPMSILHVLQDARQTATRVLSFKGLPLDRAPGITAVFALRRREQLLKHDSSSVIFTIDRARASRC